MNSTIGLLRKFQQVLPRSCLITIYKVFIRSHLGYGDVIFDQAFNNSFRQRLESIQYNAALAITGAIRRTSRKSSIKVPTIQKMVSKIISLLQNNKKRITITCLSSNSEMINFIFYSQLFFPFTIIKWNKLDSNIRCSPSYKLFRKRILECIRTHPSSVFIIPNSLLLTYLTRLRVVICMSFA